MVIAILGNCHSIHYWFSLYSFLALPLVQHSSEFHMLCAAIHHPEQDRREKKHA
jgi:hypothetical protein